MGPVDLVEHCRKQQDLTNNPRAMVTFYLPGKWGTRNTRRLWKPDGPVGKIIASEHDQILVMFRANEIIEAVYSKGGIGYDEDEAQENSA
jgi:hypothetical protein